MIENNLILINRSDDQPTHLSHAWKTLSTPDLAIASKIFKRYVTGRFTPSWEAATTCGSTESDTDRTNHLSEERTQWNYKKADWSKFQKLTDVLCRNLTLTTARTSAPVSSSWLTAYFSQQSRSSPKTKQQQCFHGQLTETRKRLEQLPSPERAILYNKERTPDEEKTKEACKSWQEKIGSLNMEKDTQKLWNLTNALNDDHSIPKEQSFWRKVPRSSRTRRQPTCLQIASDRTAYLISQGRNKQTSEWRPRNSYRNNLQPPAWHLSSPSMS